MSMKILPYKAGSESAKKLADALGIAKLKQEGSRWRGKAGDVLINWGVSKRGHPAFESQCRVLNKPEAVANAANKLISFQKFKEAEVPTPKFWTNRAEARAALEAGSTIVCRAKLNGHSGEGITIIGPDQVEDGGVPPWVPLYTNYIKKVDEYRAHVFDGKVFFVQQKKRKMDVPDDEVNWQVRNHANGFIYAHEGVDIPEDVKTISANAVKVLDLDFGAVDLIRTKSNRWYVLEVNTACGLEGTTLAKYVEQLEGLV